jgi:AcrR family transcriptional regulator
MGLRERKKQRTRTALIDAALDLFLKKGYEATTIDQIAAEVDVSPRTFFRYFASKEDVALALTADQQEIFLTELAARPETESPFTALAQAARAMLGILRELDATDASRFLQAQEIVQATPGLLAGHMGIIMDNEKKMIAEVARRQGTDPADLRPQFVVSVFTGLCLTCLGRGEQDREVLVDRLEELITLAEQSLRPGWDR